MPFASTVGFADTVLSGPSVSPFFLNSYKQVRKLLSLQRVVDVNKKIMVSLRRKIKEETAMPKSLRALVVMLAIGMGPVTAGATDFVSSNAADVAAFQAGATVLTFENIPGVTAFNNEAPGTVVPASAFLKNQVAGLTFSSNFSGGPFVLDLTGFGNISDAKSGHNILSGATPGNGSQGTVCFTCFIEVTFASPVSRVGAWNDPTGSRIQLLATDAGGTTIFGQPFANQGQFVGVSLNTNTINRALFQYISTQSVTGFTIDDLTYGTVGGGGGGSGSTVPEPTSFLLLAGGAAALVGRRVLQNIRT